MKINIKDLIKSDNINFKEYISEAAYPGIPGLDKYEDPEFRRDFAISKINNRAHERKQDFLQYGYPKKDIPSPMMADIRTSDELKAAKNLAQKTWREYSDYDDSLKSEKSDPSSKLSKDDIKYGGSFKKSDRNGPDEKLEKLKEEWLKAENNSAKILDSIKTKHGNEYDLNPKYKKIKRDDGELDSRLYMNKKVSGKWTDPITTDKVALKSKGWNDEHIQNYQNEANAQYIVPPVKESHLDMNGKIDKIKGRKQHNKKFIVPSTLDPSERFGKIDNIDLQSQTLSDLISKGESSNSFHKNIKNKPTLEEFKNSKAFVDNTPQKNKDRYKDIASKYHYAKLPEYESMINPIFGIQNEKKQHRNVKDNTADDIETAYLNNTSKKKKETPKRNVHIPKGLAKRNEVLALGGILGTGIGLNKYSNLAESYELPFDDSDDDLSLGHMAGAAGAIHVGQNLASKALLNKSQGQKVGEQIFNPSNSKFKNAVSGLKYTVAPEIGMIHNAIQDNVQGLKHNNEPNKVKDLILIKKALQGDFATVLHSKHFQDSKPLQAFLKDKLKIPVDNMLYDYNTNIKPKLDKKASRSAQIELLRRTLTNPYETVYKESSIGDFNSGFAKNLSGKNIRKLKTLDPKDYEKSTKFRDMTQMAGAGALAVAEPIAGGLTLAKQVLSKKYDPNTHPRITAAQNLMHQVLVDNPSKRAYYTNAKAGDVTDTNYRGQTHLGNNALKFGGNVLAGEVSDLTGKMTHLAKNDNLNYLDAVQTKNASGIKRDMHNSGAFRDGNYDKNLNDVRNDVQSGKVNTYKDFGFIPDNKEKKFLDKRLSDEKIDKLGTKALNELEKNSKEIHDRTKKQFVDVQKDENRYNKLNSLKFKRNVNQLLFGKKKSTRKINESTLISSKKSIAILESIFKNIGLNENNTGSTLYDKYDKYSRRVGKLNGLHSAPSEKVGKAVYNAGLPLVAGLTGSFIGNGVGELTDLAYTNNQGYDSEKLGSTISDFGKEYNIKPVETMGNDIEDMRNFSRDGAVLGGVLGSGLGLMQTNKNLLSPNYQSDVNDIRKNLQGAKEKIVSPFMQHKFKQFIKKHNK